MLKINLLNNKVLIKSIEKNTTTASGFILPEDNKEDKIREGEIIAVGNGSRNDKGERVKLDVEVGQKIVYEHSSYNTHEIEFEKEKYLIISENDIIGILK